MSFFPKMIDYRGNLIITRRLHRSIYRYLLKKINF